MNSGPGHASRPDFLGTDPSDIGQAAVARCLAAGAHDVLELGPGQGRDTLLFASAGLVVTAVDYAEPGLAQITDEADAAGLSPGSRRSRPTSVSPFLFRPRVSTRCTPTCSCAWP